MPRKLREVIVPEGLVHLALAHNSLAFVDMKPLNEYMPQPRTIPILRQFIEEIKPYLPKKYR